MKKWLSTILAATMLFSSVCLFAGCGQDGEKTDTAKDVLATESELVEEVVETDKSNKESAVTQEDSKEPAENVVNQDEVSQTNVQETEEAEETVVIRDVLSGQTPVDSKDVVVVVPQTTEPEDEPTKSPATTVAKKPTFSITVPSVSKREPAASSNTVTSAAPNQTAESTVVSSPAPAPAIQISVKECMLVVTPNESFSGTYNVIVKGENGTVYTPNSLCVLTDEGTADTVIDLRLSFNNGVLAEGTYTVSVESDNGVVSNEATWNYTRVRLAPTLTISGTTLTIVDAYSDKTKGNEQYLIYINGNGISYAVHGDGNLYTNQGDYIGYIDNSSWKKTVTFDLSSLPAGTYKICVGYVKGGCDWTCIDYTI